MKKLLNWSFVGRRRRERGRLLRNYFLISVSLIAGGLIASGLVEIYLRYQESKTTLALLQEASASVAALRIEKFIEDVETAMRSTAKGHETSSNGIFADYRFEFKRLFFLAPAISEVSVLDASGVEQANLSRLRVFPAKMKKDFSDSPAFRLGKQGLTYFSPVYFVRGSEPYLTVALPVEQFKGNIVGVLQAEVNLKSILDVVTSIKAGRAGYAYAVSRSGDLIAHPDISLVLQHRKISDLGQVRAALEVQSERFTGSVANARNFAGRAVISSFASVPRLGWAVFIERPIEEAYETVYASVLRMSVLLLVGLSMALFASFFVARRVIRPLRILGQGVDRIGKGDLDFRVKLKTADELETLAEEFNKMARALQEAYGRLEEKVTERTQDLASANQKLAEASRHKSAFLAGMSHELRTPLNAIIGFSEVLLDTELAVTEAEKKQFLTDILNGGRHLLRLINEVLDLSKIEAGRMELQIKPVSLEKIIERAQSIVRPLANQKRIVWRCDSNGGTDFVFADAARIEQVLLNLLGNAVKFTPEGGSVWVSTDHDDGSVRVEVGDNGPGIPEEERERIFLEFHQVAMTNDSIKPEGTGLGLALARMFVELHGGRLWVESEAGTGSRFYFTLPRARELT